MSKAKFILLFTAQIGAGLALLSVIVLWPGEWNLARWIGLLIATPAMALLITARTQLGRSFSVTPQARELVTHGLYCRIRNPIYVFSWLLVLGFVIALQKTFLYVFLAVLIPVQILRAKQESKVLEAKFGEAYREYRKMTWF
jgi:protein-S-isoprenylcysteine O-methyltransferase Ste14